MIKIFFEYPKKQFVASIFGHMIRLDGLQDLFTFYYDDLFPVKDNDSPILQ